MIIARKSGLMIAVKLVAENDTHYILQPLDQKAPIKVKKNSDKEKIFESAWKAVDWIESIVEPDLMLDTISWRVCSLSWQVGHCTKLLTRGNRSLR